jgi:hypothetical protein
MARLFIFVSKGLLIASAGAARQAPVPVRMIELVATPEKFNGKRLWSQDISAWLRGQLCAFTARPLSMGWA